MYKDPSLPKPQHSISKLEAVLLSQALLLVRDQEVSNSDCIKIEIVVNETLLRCQNIILQALKIISTPELLSICPKDFNNKN